MYIVESLVFYNIVCIVYLIFVFVCMRDKVEWIRILGNLIIFIVILF